MNPLRNRAGTEDGKNVLGSFGLAGRFGLHLRHFTAFFRAFAAYSTLSDLIFYHGIIGRTGASKFISRKDVSDIDQCET